METITTYGVGPDQPTYAQLREQNRVLRLEFQSLLNVIDDSYDEDLPVEIVEARNKAQAALTATSQPGGTHEL